jgi:hypothetical protein
VDGPHDCPDCAPRLGLSRRRLLQAAGALPVALGIGSLPGRPAQAAAAVEVAPGLRILPRAAWADLPPTGPLQVEQRGDVRFLLVHHTASPNGYAPADVAGQLRRFFRFHTGDRGWNDLAYNFLVDRFGGVWEGRQGSLGAPMKADATGGSQGFAQLACFVGDHSATAPTDEAREAMLRVLAWLADRHGIDTAPGATATFVSRGSNLHPAGASVTTATVAGHRDMSVTSCPGDVVYAQVRSTFPTEVTALRTAAAAPPAPDPPPEPTPEPSPEPTPEPTPEAAGPVRAPPTANPAPAATRGEPFAVEPTAVVAGLAAAAGAAGVTAAVRTRGRVESGGDGQED